MATDFQKLAVELAERIIRNGFDEAAMFNSPSSATYDALGEVVLGFEGVSVEVQDRARAVRAAFRQTIDGKTYLFAVEGID
ncbi:MAG: hypothetical protein EBT15_09785 [Betaproteobacteria bacterium]|nr:hypothetical protein [Betaproteobacteria bacterium]